MKRVHAIRGQAVKPHESPAPAIILGVMARPALYYTSRAMMFKRLKPTTEETADAESATGTE